MKIVVKSILVSIILFFVLQPATLAKGTISPREVELGIYVLNFGALDINEGTFTAEFYLTLKDSKPIVDTSFELLNGKVRKMKVVNVYKESRKYVKTYLIEADLTTKINLRDYPFDKQQLPVCFESTEESTDKMIYVPIKKSIDIDPNQQLPGWIIKNTQTRVKEHYYPIFQEGYSQYVFTAIVGKNKIHSYFQTLTSISFIILICLLSFLLGADKLHVRSKITNVALIASVMFFRKVVDQIPAVNYLTFLDKFMVLTYVVLIMYIVFNVYVTSLQNKNNDKKIEVLQKYAFPVFTSITFLSFLGLFIVYLS